MSDNDIKRFEGPIVLIGTAIFIVGIFVRELLNQWDVSTTTKTLVVIAVSLVLLIVVVAALAWAYRKLPRVSGTLNFVVLALSVGTLLIIPLVVFDTNERLLLLKLGALLFLSLLPGWLYLQFVSVKGRTLWDEYVLNLYRLHVDDASHLPEPPYGSVFYEISQKSRLKDSGDGRENLYAAKFRGLYGHAGIDGTGDGGRDTTARLQGENLFPVVLCTLVLAAGWAMALDPERILGQSFLPSDFLSGAPFLPADPLRFGFAGAYFYILQMLVRRYYQDDLKTSAYINAMVRIIVVVLLITTLHQAWPSDWGGEVVFAFFIGIFPDLGLQALRALVALPLRKLVPTLKKEFPLSDLEGMNIWYEGRLLEEGIEDLQNFSTADIVDVMLRTRIPVDRLVDWIDQAHLYLHVTGDDADKKGGTLSSREKLKRRGIRTATDLENIFQSSDPDFQEAHRWLLNPNTDPPSITETIVTTLKDEPNLHHVRRWKRFAVDLEKRDAQTD